MSPAPNLPAWTPERLAYWYFRLNGFLTTENFIVHPDTGSDQRTDADLLAVRFAHRGENPRRPMKDDPKIASCRTFANVVIAEVKTGQRALNGPWTDRLAGNMKRVLKGIGCVPEASIDIASDDLHNQGVWSDSAVTIRLFALGESRVGTLPIPLGQQLTWDEVIEFCVERFGSYEREKSSVGQWTEDGRRLRADATDPNPKAAIRHSFGLRLDADPPNEA